MRVVRLDQNVSIKSLLPVIFAYRGVERLDRALAGKADI